APWSVLCSTRHDAAKRDRQAPRGGSQSRTYTRPHGKLLEENDSARIACNSRPRSRGVALVWGGCLPIAEGAASRRYSPTATACTHLRAPNPLPRRTREKP